MTPLLIALLLSQAPAKQKVVATENATGKAVDFGDFANKAARVNCVTGCGSGGLTDAQLRASAVPVSVSGAVSVTGTFFQATQPVSGTVAVSTGFLLDTTFTGRINTLGQKTMANSTPVVLASDQSAIPVSQSATWTVQPGNTANTTAWKVDGSAVTQPVSGTVTANQGGTWTDRIVGNAGAALDAVNNAAAPANVLVVGAQLQSGASATAGTAGQVGNIVAGLDHVLYARIGGPVNWSCFLPLTTTATTICQAAPAAGLKNYVVSLNCSNGAATVQGLDVVYGTTAGCASGTTALTHKYQMGTNATTTSPYQVDQNYGTGLVPAAAAAICVRPTAATAFGCTLSGTTAP